MLTLQQLLESDSLSTVVAKLNQNFQSLSLSNGGPQGIRGAQGIPGLPGKQGQQGATGPAGATAGGVGIVPFACIDSTGPTAIGPTVDSLPSIGTVGPWPYSSWEWLQYYHVSGGAGYDGNPPQNQELYIDPANGGYWQYLETPDEQGASCDGGYTSGGAYSYTGSGSYPDLGPTAGWGGPGWYWYPSTGNGAGGNNLGDVWTNDFTTYLISPNNGPYAAGPYFNEPTPLTIANARLLSKYGTVWITSGNDGLAETNDFTETSTIGNWGDGSGNANDGPQPGRNNAGVDRLLFKMSIDGLPYLSNIVARGYSGATAGTFNPAPSITYPRDTDGDQMINGVTISGYTTYWTSPQYNVNLGDYSPLLFLSHRDPSDAQAFGTYGSLGFYMYTATDNSDGSVPTQPSDPYGTGGEIQNNNVSRTLHVMSSRYSTDPLPLYTNQSLDSSKTKNYGELVFDTRRVIASNQYVCSLPADMKLSSDYRALGPSRYDENSADLANLYKYRTFQGYISAINGKSLTGDPEYGDFWEYGLGGDRNGPVSGYTSGTHDQQSGTAGMQTRRTWYGSSVLNEKSSQWDANQPGANDYVRVAGMMERGRRFNDTDFLSQGGTTGTNGTYFYSELIFYTSQFRVSVDELVNGVGVTIDQIDPDFNEHKSRPSLYVSPFGSIGIGTFAGGATATNDVGPLEPSAKLHVHGKYTDLEDDPNAIYKSITAGTGLFSTLPTESFAVAAFTADGTGSRLTDILLGGLAPEGIERVTPVNNIVNSMNDTLGVTAGAMLKNAIRSEHWGSYDLSTLRLGVMPKSNSTQQIGRNSVAAYAQEFQLSIHPLTTGTAGSLESDLSAIAGVGIHNLYPRTRTHFYGKNLYNESEYGQELWTPGGVIAGGSATLITQNYPFYGLTAQNSPSNNQVIIDYIGDSYQYPVGIYEYQYYSWGATGNPVSTGIMSPNSAVYPNREAPTINSEFPTRYSVPYGGITYTNYAYPSTTGGAIFNNSYKHGGRTNAWFGPSSYIGFNLFRDLSGTAGDNRDLSRWMLGTQGTDGIDNGNNGAAALFMGSHGDLGIATIPRGFDGGRGYEQWEQRGLGTRDVLNQIKFVFDSHGNLGIANRPGWDLDAYASLERNPNSGYLYYVRRLSNGSIYTPITVGTAGSPGFTGQGITYTNAVWQSGYRPGMPAYINITESVNKSGAAQINKLATLPEYIRLEVAAEKAWTREGRSLQKQGYGYPPNATISMGTNVWRDTYVAPTVLGSPFMGGALFRIITDSEGRIVQAYLDGVKYTGFLDSNNWNILLTRMVFPHPTEFNAGGPLSSFAPGFIAPPGAQAAEWWYNSIDSPPSSSSETVVVTGGAPSYNIYFVFTTDTRGSANVRLNNFVYGEGYGFSNTGPTGQVAQTSLGTTANNSYLYTQNKIKEKRQESPKLILSFLESDASASLNTVSIGTQAASIVSVNTAKRDPYRKVNTVIASAQNEAALREYWIPKTDNTGGTFMVFTDQFGEKEKDTGFSTRLTEGNNYSKLRLMEVVSMEMIQSYTGSSNARVDDLSEVYQGMYSRNTLNTRGGAVSMGYVKYFNTQYDRSGSTPYFLPTEYGQKLGISAEQNIIIGMTGGGINSSGIPFGYSGGGRPLLYGGAAGVIPQEAILMRNLDKYYQIYQGPTTPGGAQTSANQNWTGTNVSDNNKATSIRFNRINSEYALVDFNITVEVNNPEITGAGADGDTGQTRINFGVPTMTQTVKFIYNIDANEIPGNALDEWGNSVWLTAWSSYKNFLPGTALVGDDLLNISTNENNLGSGYETAAAVQTPFFTSSGSGLPQTWNGNFIDFGFYRKLSPNLGYLDAIYSLISPNDNVDRTDNPPTLQGSGNTNRSPGGRIHGQFDLAFINSAISCGLTNWNYGYIPSVPPLTADLTDQATQFMSRIRSYYSIWGNMTMSRVRNMMWRMVPFYYNDSTAAAPGAGTANNTFIIEVIFDVPIMHTYHAFSGVLFDQTNNISPYRYLTLSGQGIVRYGRTNITSGNR